MNVAIWILAIWTVGMIPPAAVVGYCAGRYRCFTGGHPVLNWFMFVPLWPLGLLLVLTCCMNRIGKRRRKKAIGDDPEVNERIHVA